MKKRWFYRLLILVGVLFLWGETAYFGWNKTPKSGLESMCDTTAQLVIIWGLIGDITTNLSILAKKQIMEQHANYRRKKAL